MLLIRQPIFCTDQRLIWVGQWVRWTLRVQRGILVTLEQQALQERPVRMEHNGLTELLIQQVVRELRETGLSTPLLRIFSRRPILLRGHCRPISRVLQEALEQPDQIIWSSLQPELHCQPTPQSLQRLRANCGWNIRRDRNSTRRVGVSR